MSTPLAARVGDRLARQGLTLALAESCTGGLLGARLTDAEGASRFLVAGLTTYSNAAKTDLLGVPESLVSQHGAVSEQVARAMAEGARNTVSADAAVAITGVAGPGGGSVEKPVGTVWIAAAVGATVTTRRFTFDGDRAAIREAAVEQALILLESLLEVV